MGWHVVHIVKKSLQFCGYKNLLPAAMPALNPAPLGAGALGIGMGAEGVGLGAGLATPTRWPLIAMMVAFETVRPAHSARVRGILLLNWT